MNYCYHCDKEIHDDNYEMVTVDIGGPHPGCAEFASEEHDVPVCAECLKCEFCDDGGCYQCSFPDPEDYI